MQQQTKVALGLLAGGIGLGGAAWLFSAAQDTGSDTDPAPGPPPPTPDEPVSPEGGSPVEGESPSEPDAPELGNGDESVAHPPDPTADTSASAGAPPAFTEADPFDVFFTDEDALPPPAQQPAEHAVKTDTRPAEHDLAAATQAEIDAALADAERRQLEVEAAAMAAVAHLANAPAPNSDETPPSSPPEWKPPVLTDPGYPDEGYRGLYDSTGSGKCQDYCRWVGGTGPPPAGKQDPLQYTASTDGKGGFWSCEQPVGSGKNTPAGHFGHSFKYSRCVQAYDQKGATEMTPPKPRAWEVEGKDCALPQRRIADQGHPDSYRGWYDVQGCGKCNDYCRWVGTGLPGVKFQAIDPARMTVSPLGYHWSCALAGQSTEYTRPGHFGPSFRPKKCVDPLTKKSLQGIRSPPDPKTS